MVVTVVKSGSGRAVSSENLTGMDDSNHSGNGNCSSSDSPDVKAEPADNSDNVD